MPLATSNGPSKFKSLFDGDLSSADSESDSAKTAVASVSRSPSKKARAKKAKGVVQPPRPRRQEVVKSYAESDTDGEDLPAVPVKSGKRKRNSSLNGSPTKKAKLDLLQAPRSRSFSSGQVQSHQARGIVASISASWPETGNPFSPPLVTSRKRAFIRLGLDGQPAGSTSADTYWWPAKKVAALDGSVETIYQLYGDDGHGNARNVTIYDLLPTSTQSIYYPKPPLPRYSQTSFQKGSIVDSARFLAAFNELNQDDDDEDDDEEEETLPPEELLSDAEHAPPSQASAPDWRPPSPSEFVSLVDQLVLCKSKSGSTVYWPARITAYIAPTKPSQKPRFEVGFFDWRTGEVTRDMFFTQYDEDERNFITCELDRRKLQDWVDKNSFSPTDGVVTADVTNLPEPRIPIPKPSILIDQMTIEEQFVYVIPFMSRVLDESYLPSQERIDKWMQGGSARSGVTNAPIQGGHLAEVEWQQFGRLVHNWALPGPKASDTEAMDADPQSTSEPSERPRGSERYESLPLGQKLQFVMDVLIGEAVIQLLVIRAGKRSHLQILGDAEEAELHDFGFLMSKQPSTTIMVGTILDTRRALRAKRGLPSESLIAPGAKPPAESELGVRRRKTRVHSHKKDSSKTLE